MGKRWSAAVAANLLMGVPGVVPIWLLWYFAVNWPLKALGWTAGNPTENDGMLPWFMLGGPIVTAAALLWWFANRALRSRALPGQRLYWPASAVAFLTPTLALVVTGI